MSQWFSVFCAAYGCAFLASGHILKWAPAKVNGLLWWAAGMTIKFLGASEALAVFAGMALVGEVGFGLYAMAHERKVLASGE